MTPFLVLLASVFLPMAVLVCVMVVRQILADQDKRRSPLTIKVLNLPGEGLRRAIAKHDEAFDTALLMAIAIGPITLAAWLLTRLKGTLADWSTIELGPGDAIVWSCVLVVTTWASWQLVKHAGVRKKYKQGLEAELAVAQCLIPLTAEGLAVFHDFPADKFNIDHIVVGRSAVFAIETKARRKPAEKGPKAARVVYDGQQLRFPTHSENGPIGQATNQAKWLERFLASGVGEPVRVIPVLALPGWYVENITQRPEVLVSNCHNSRFMASESFGPSLADSMRKRIAHVLSERYPGLGTED